MPRVVADALKAREMVSRVVALSALSLVVGSLETGAPHPLLAAGRLAWAIGPARSSGPRSAGPWFGCASASSPRRWRRGLHRHPLPLLAGRALARAVRRGRHHGGGADVAAVRVDRERARRAPPRRHGSRPSPSGKGEPLGSSAMFFLAGLALPRPWPSQPWACGAWPARRRRCSSSSSRAVRIRVSLDRAPPLAAGLQERRRGEEGGAGDARGHGGADGLGLHHLGDRLGPRAVPPAVAGGPGLVLAGPPAHHRLVSARADAPPRRARRGAVR